MHRNLVMIIGVVLFLNSVAFASRDVEFLRTFNCSGTVKNLAADPASRSFRGELIDYKDGENFISQFNFKSGMEYVYIAEGQSEDPINGRDAQLFTNVGYREDILTLKSGSEELNKTEKNYSIFFGNQSDANNSWAGSIRCVPRL